MLFNGRNNAAYYRQVLQRRQRVSCKSQSKGIKKKKKENNESNKYKEGKGRRCGGHINVSSLGPVLVFARGSPQFGQIYRDSMTTH